MDISNRIERMIEKLREMKEIADDLLNRKSMTGYVKKYADTSDWDVRVEIDREITFRVDTYEQVKDALKILNKLAKDYGKDTLKIGSISSSGTIATCNWWNGQGFWIMFQCPIADFPKELISDGCGFKTIEIPASEATTVTRYVCEGVGA